MNSVSLDPPPPRGDVLVRDLDGVDRRRTEYVGTAWIDGRPVIEGLALRPQAGAGPKGIRVPSGAPTWIHVRISAHAPWPTGIGYRIVALTDPDAVG